jgi:hypothetical protein
MTSSRLYDDDDERRYALTNQDFRDASEQLLFVFPELRGSFRSPTSSTLESSHRASVHNSNNSATKNGIMAVGDRHSGVLWKRRDVFKNRWRPRWFVLNPGQGILTYYLLNAAAAVALPPSSAASATTTTTTPRMSTPDDSQHSNGSRNKSNTPTTSHQQQQQQQRPSSSSSSSNHPRLRTTSWDSQVSGVSENSVDYDVVPRGTIFLLGCTVEINDLLTKPSEHLYVFTIQPPSSSTESRVHLAARTIQARQIWVERIAIVCHRRPPPPPILFPPQQPSLPTPTHFLQSPSTTLYQQQHSIPEDDVLHVVDDDSPVSNNSPPHQWSTMGPTERLYQHLPASLVTMIQEKINTYLPMCCCQTADNDLQRPPWKMIMQNDTITAAVTTDLHTGRSIVQSRKRFTDLPVLHIFSLLIDISRRHLYESNVQIDERIQVLNDHTFLDYYSYKAVRNDFLVVVVKKCVAKIQRFVDIVFYTFAHFDNNN